MAGQQPEKGEGGGSGDDDAPSSRADRSDRYDRDRDEEQSYLNDIGLKRLRLMVSRYGDDEVERFIFDALKAAYLDPTVDTVEELLERARYEFVRRRDEFPGNTAYRNAEYWVGGVHAVVSRDYLYSVLSAGIPAYDVMKAYAWAMKDMAPFVATPLGKSVLDFPEWLQRSNKDNPTTRPGLGGIRATFGVMDAVWIDRDVSWQPPSSRGPGTRSMGQYPTKDDF